MDTWHHLRGLPEASSLRNLEFSNKMTISHEIQQFRMIVRNFRMVMRNQLWNFPLICSKKCLLIHFAWSCEMEIHNFSLIFFISSIFFFWIHLNHLQIPFKTNCITYFIMYLDLHQLYLFSSIWFISFVTNLSKSYLEITPKLPKTC